MANKTLHHQVIDYYIRKNDIPPETIRWATVKILERNLHYIKVSIDCPGSSTFQDLILTEDLEKEM